MLLNALYLLALSLLSPWLLWRRVRTGRYRSGVAAKLLGRVTVENPQHKPVAWFHGVSVGEIHLLSTVVAAFRKRHPDWLVVVSSTTDTGVTEARNRFADLPVIPWPFDFTWAVRRAMAAVNPTLLVLAEGELWPNAVRAAKGHGAQVVVINARMSPRSFRRSRRLAGLLKSFVYQYVDCFAVQSDDYAERFRQLGVEPGKIVVTGSVKYDGAIGERNTTKTSELKRLLGLSPSPLTPLPPRERGTKPQPKDYLVAGSTHAPEEQIVLDAFSKLRGRFSNLHLLLVPRHPDRFEGVAKLIAASGMSFVRRSAISEPMGQLPPIILLDTVGELGAVWSLATVGYVGGTLDGKRGGQSMIEPAGFGVPTVFGPHVWNFRDAAGRLVETGGAAMVKSADEVETAIAAILNDPAKRAKMGEVARQFVANQQGATARTLDVLDELMGLGRPVTRAA
jgi:3-deoxy-D-manno-octulosonic-acid transferase